MTNPDSALGTNGAYGGRTSVNAFNDVLNCFNGSGILSGWTCSPSSGLTVALGGVSGTRDVAIAEDPDGNKTTINNISGDPVEVTMEVASVTADRVDVIVAYVNSPASVDTTTLDNPSAVGIIPVSGTTGSTSAPSESTIRSAITSDGGTGTTAYYVVLATIAMTASLATISSSEITQGEPAYVGDPLITEENIDFTACSDLFYQSGDQITLDPNTPLPAFVTGSTKSLHILVPVGKRLDNATSYQVNACTMYVRTTAGYINSASTGIDFTGSGYTTTLTRVSGKNSSMLHLRVVKSSAYTNVTNNTPCMATTSSTSGFNVTII